MFRLRNRFVPPRVRCAGRPVRSSFSRWNCIPLPGVLLVLVAFALPLPSLHAAHPLEPLPREILEVCSLYDDQVQSDVGLNEPAAPLRAHAPSYLPAGTSIITVQPASQAGTDWTAALHQSARFLFIQHAVRIGTQKKTRRSLRGPFFRDYVDSLRGFSGWDDGDSFLTNYVGHPMQGSISGYFQVHNHPRERLLEFSSHSSYWKSRFKAMAFNAAYSTNYELSPIGEAAIGNVGLRPGTKGAVDLVITPTLGFAWMVGEDAIDAKIIAPLERRLRNPGSRRLLRTALNPTRTFANFLRGVAPWHRDTRGDVK